MSIRISSFSGCSAGTMIPARLGSASWMMMLSLVRLLRISIRLLPLKPMLIGEPLYSQDNCSFADVEKSISSEETSKRPDSMWNRMSWLLSLANGNRVVVRVAAINQSASHNAVSKLDFCASVIKLDDSVVAVLAQNILQQRSWLLRQVEC